MPVRGMALTIEPINEEFVFGRPATFRVLLKNVGERAYWVPREPHILFHWIYPTGLRDHYVRERPTPTFRQTDDVILLEPGFQLVYLEHIETFYFPKPGIVEFRALYISPENLNPKIAPYWSGRIVSNIYGIRLN